MSAARPIVAVVDDDPGTSRAIARMVELVGMAPVLYASAEGLLEEGPDGVDCAIVDVHLPGMDGIELCERLADAVPVILVSASEEAEERVRAMPRAPRAFLAKPFPGHALLETLKRLVGEADAGTMPAL